MKTWLWGTTCSFKCCNLSYKVRWHCMQLPMSFTGPHTLGIPKSFGPAPNRKPLIWTETDTYLTQLTWDFLCCRGVSFISSVSQYRHSESLWKSFQNQRCTTSILKAGTQTTETSDFSFPTHNSSHTQICFKLTLTWIIKRLTGVMKCGCPWRRSMLLTRDESGKNVQSV